MREELLINKNRVISADKEFAFETARLFNDKLRLALLLVGIPVVSIYFLIDFLTNEIVFRHTAPVRVTVIAIFYIITQVLKKSNASPDPHFRIAFFAAFCVTSMNIYVLDVFDAFGVETYTIHLAGYTELLLGSVLFISWPSIKSMTGMFVSVAVPALAFRPLLKSSFSVPELQFHLGVLFTIYLVAAHQTRLNNSVRRREFEARKSLENENLNRSQIIEQKVSEIRAKELELNNTKVEAETMRKVSEITFRVAHDIRSPLTALNLAASTISEVNSAQKQLISGATKRISDIAKGLLDEKRRINSNSANQFQAAIAVEKIVSEKRLIHGSEINIVYTLESNSLALFINCDRVRFEATLSNLIQNAIDASRGKALPVRVSQERVGKRLGITIRDEGVGIPDEVLAKLGKQSISTKGSLGSGIGVSTAFEFAKSNGGEVSIESKVGLGTTVTLLFPCSEGPTWMADHISLKNHTNVVVIDDDKSVHEIWMGRLANFNREIEAYESPEEYSSKTDDPKVFLVDYYFSNSAINGFDYLKNINPTNARYLVTSEHENEDLRKNCESQGIKIVPKSLVPLIPIKS